MKSPVLLGSQEHQQHKQPQLPHLSGALDAANAHASIAATGLLCVKYFNRLTEVLQASDHSRKFEPHISAVAIQDEFGRFKVWAANNGALQPVSRSPSLEHRLREAPKVKDHVIKLLRDLNHSLTGCKCISTGL